jgi:hypothetical protein
MVDGRITFKVDGADFEIDEALEDWAVVGCGGERWLGHIDNMIDFSRDYGDGPTGGRTLIGTDAPALALLRPAIELSSLAQTVAVVVMDEIVNGRTLRVPKEGMQAIYDGIFPLNKLSLHRVTVRWTSIQLCAEMSNAARAICLSTVKNAIDRAQGKDSRVQRAGGGGLYPGRQ